MTSANNKDECLPLRELQGKKLIGYTIGTIGYIIPIALVTAFAYQFYVYTVGLDSLLTSIGIFIGLTIAAFGATIFGVISDNKKPGKLGKRRPFILCGMILLVTTNFLCWIPPLCPQGQPYYIPTTIYFWIVFALLNVANSMIISPYTAMIPEQCQTEENRVKVAAIIGIFNILGTVLGVLFPMILQSNLEDPTAAKWWEPSGAYLVSLLPWVGGLLGLFGGIIILISFLSVDESFHLQNPKTIQEKKSIVETFKQMFEPSKNPKFRNYLFQTSISSIGGRILIVILVPFLTYVIQLVDIQFIIFILILVPFAFIGFVFWNKQIPKMGLIKTNVMSNYIITGTLLAIFIFLISMDFSLRVIIGGILISLALFCFVGAFLYPNPIISALVDEKAVELNSGNRLESTSKLSGSYFGLNLLLLNFFGAVANIILGAIFTGGNEENPILIVITFPIAAFLFLATNFFLRKIKLEKSE